MFFDRHMAGELLAKKLTRFKYRDVVLYALPKGGVPVGYEVSKALGLPLDFLTVQKIGHPLYPEYGICSVSETGNLICDESGICGLDRNWLSNEIRFKEEEAYRRRALYKRGEPSASPENKIAIIIDDGIATGITMKAAVQAIQDKWPEQIIIATPVMPHALISEFRKLSDAVVTLIDDREYLGTVGAYYSYFAEVTDYEVTSLLAKANHHFVQSLPQMSESAVRYKNNN